LLVITELLRLDIAHDPLGPVHEIIQIGIRPDIEVPEPLEELV